MKEFGAHPHDVAPMTRSRSFVKRLLAALAVALLVYAAFVVLGLPARAEVRALVRKNPDQTALMKQREREAKAKGRTARRAQAFVPVSPISRWLIQAVISSEDQNFFGHQGVDWTALQESVEKNFEKHRFARGGSTITQQLAKNLFLRSREEPHPQAAGARDRVLVEAALGKDASSSST